MNDLTKNELLSDVAKYYADKLAKFGETPQGVDWNGAESQTLRFKQLCKIIRSTGTFSINDLGCGYGALYDFLEDHYQEFSYTGVDVSNEMIEAAIQRLHGATKAQFIASDEPLSVADYGVASGIFNVRLGRSDAEWQNYLEAVLDVLDRTSRYGFSFNCLTSYSDEDKMRDYLYYADPTMLFDLCKKRYSQHVALLHDYGLYEFTILVRKQI